MDINELEYVKNDNNFTEEEMNKFDGTRAKVAKVETKMKTSKWAEDGKELPAGQVRETMVVVVETVPIKVSGMGIPIPVKEEFNLKKHKSTGKWVASLHEKSKTYKLFKKYNINTFVELKDKEIILSKKINMAGNANLGISLG